MSNLVLFLIFATAWVSILALVTLVAVVVERRRAARSPESRADTDGKDE